MRFEARLRRPVKDGAGSQRDHLEALASQRVPAAIAALEGPPYPEELRYLHEWFLELDSARGEGMMGLAPLTYPQVDAWARLQDRRPRPHEVRALFRLDLASRYPDPA